MEINRVPSEAHEQFLFINRNPAVFTNFWYIIIINDLFQTEKYKTTVIIIKKLNYINTINWKLFTT